MLILYTSRGGGLEEALYQSLLIQLPEDLQEKVNRYVRRQDAEACLLGKLLLRAGLQGLGFDGETLIRQLQYTDFGRPYLNIPVDFNISHSGEYVLCALSSTCRVGADIEQIRPIVLPHFRGQMTDAEWAQVTDAPDPVWEFYHYWTRKEAAIKAHGHGLSLPLQEIILGHGEVIMEGRAWPLYKIHLSPAYVCHVVTDIPVDQRDIRVEKLDFRGTI